MKPRTIELRSGTWEWSVVDPDDPRRRARPSPRALAVSGGSTPEPSHASNGQDAEATGIPPLPRRRIELRSTENGHHRMSVRVPPHLGKAGDDAAVTMLALNPDRRIVIDPQGATWALWPEQHEPAATHASLAGPRLVRAKRQGDRPRLLSLPEGLALGQLTDREILDLLG